MSPHAPVDPPPPTYDAVVLVSFGGPNGPEDVLPFLRNVTSGKNIPDARLEQVGTHYALFGGRSPINAQNLALLDALRPTLVERSITVPVEWANRNWHPLFPEVLGRLAGGGARRVLALGTSAYPSYSGCRQYREDLALGAPGGLEVDLVAPYAQQDGFLAAQRDIIAAARAEMVSRGGSGDPYVVFVTHSLPVAMADASGPVAEHGEGGAYVTSHLRLIERLVADLGLRGADLAYCSRSGPPHQAWLEPDVNDHLQALAGRGEKDVLVVPLGFTSDHMEVVYDLDVEARATAGRLGMRMVRAATVGTHPAFVGMLADQVEAAFAGPGALCGRGRLGGPDCCGGGRPRRSG